MRLRTLAFALAVVSVTSLAPAAPPTSSAPPVAPTREHIEPLAPEVVAARAAAFEKANPGWKVSLLPGARYRPEVLGARREKHGAPVRVTEASAAAAARTFLVKNATYLGITTHDAATLAPDVKPYPSHYPDVAHHRFLVDFADNVGQPGFERFPDRTRRIGLTMAIADDGQPSTLNSSYADLPDLHIRTKPGLAEDDPRVTEKVIGRPLFRYTPVGAVPNSYQSTYKASLLGFVRIGDVKRVRLRIITDSKGVGQDVWLAYEVTVNEGEDERAFLVDPDTGLVVRDPEPPGPIVSAGR